MTTYAYDVLGNLRSVALPDSTLIDYVVDGRNRRVGKKVNGVIERQWIFDGQLRPAAELDETGALISQFVYATHINVPDYMVKGGVTYRIITDHLGSLRFVIDTATGTIAQRMDYDDWGNVLVNTAPDFTPFGFAGGMYDSQTKLTRFGARDYDPETGRWTAKDPIGLQGGLNTYTYLGDNPVAFIDPYGQWEFKGFPADIVPAAEQAIRNAIRALKTCSCEEANFPLSKIRQAADALQHATVFYKPGESEYGYCTAYTPITQWEETGYFFIWGDNFSSKNSACCPAKKMAHEAFHLAGATWGDFEAMIDATVEKCGVPCK